MTKNELNEKIEKVLVKIEKIEKRIEKWQSKKNEQSFIKLEAQWYSQDPKTIKTMQDLIIARYNCIDKKYQTNLDYSKKYIEKSYNEHIAYCDNEIKYANNDLENQKRILQKYQNEITKIENFENEKKIEVLVKFLEDWKTKTYKWYMNNASLYIDLKRQYKEKLNDHMKQFENLDFRTRYYKEQEFNKQYYSNITAFTKEIVEYTNEINYEKLIKAIDEEAIRKYKDLVKRISEVVGKIENAKHLSIGEQNGEINGIVIGSKATARIETISAGGYNIQCFHYRVLVHKI